MNCDLDIENRPNKDLKTVQNPSVSETQGKICDIICQFQRSWEYY